MLYNIIPILNKTVSYILKNVNRIDLILSTLTKNKQKNNNNNKKPTKEHKKIFGYDVYV